MAEKTENICAVCFVLFGNRSDKLIVITDSIEKLIKEFVWYEFDRRNSSCPDKICKSCRIRLYAVNRGETQKLDIWMEKLGQVRSYINLFTYR